ncbi:MAG: hypothetical protein AAF958_03550 [Planctomycetota bacterium]
MPFQPHHKSSAETWLSGPIHETNENLMRFFTLVLFLSLLLLNPVASAQTADTETGELAAEDRAGDTAAASTIIVTPGKTSPPKFLFSATAKSNAQVSNTEFNQRTELTIRVVQGDAGTATLALAGDGEVSDVAGDALQSWAIGQQDGQRFLELRLKPKTATADLQIRWMTPFDTLPTEMDVPHLEAGEAVGFSASLRIGFETSVTAKVIRSEGFTSLQAEAREQRWQSTGGGRLTLRMLPSDALPPPVAWRDTTLSGIRSTDQKSVDFRLRGTAIVNQAGTRVSILSGNVAMLELPTRDEYRLVATAGSSGSPAPTYELEFLERGEFELDLPFVAAVQTTTAGWQSLSVNVQAGTIVPVSLEQWDGELEFDRKASSVIPVRKQDAWQTFVPADGRLDLTWRNAEQTETGKLFFTTDAFMDARVAPGVLRQDHRIEYRILQGELPELRMRLLGPGEVLAVEAADVVGWKVSGDGPERELQISLSRAIRGQGSVLIRSQTPYASFPATLQVLRVEPVDALRHSGHVRIASVGSVRLEIIQRSGLTQLSPDQSPGDAIRARQIFAYRFPSPDYQFAIACDRVQPEINVRQTTTYGLSETDRTIEADLELDIREAAIRDWNVRIPADYSLVSVAGAKVADYVASSDVAGGSRNLKIVFADDTIGRQLIKLQLEKTQTTKAETWQLPRLDFPDAESVQGDVGVRAASGFRVGMESIEGLTEKPLSYFPKRVANLQQVFRVRRVDWTATMQIETLDRSVQSDVFHLYSLSQNAINGSALVNYFVAGAPVSQWRLRIPQSLGNLTVDGSDIRNWRREGDTLVVDLHQAVMGAYTLLVTFEEKPDPDDGTIAAATIAPLDVQGDRGWIQVVSPTQVDLETVQASERLLKLDAMELPAEFRLLSTAPSLGTWQYTSRPFQLKWKIRWFQPGTTRTQVVEFSEANSKVSADGELVTDVVYYVKSRGQQMLRVKLPDAPARLWSVSVGGTPVTARQSEDATLIPLPGDADPNAPIEVMLRLGKPAVDGPAVKLALPTVLVPVLKTRWKIAADENHLLIPSGGTVQPPRPVIWPSGFQWIAGPGMPLTLAVLFFVVLTSLALRGGNVLHWGALFMAIVSVVMCLITVATAARDIGSPDDLVLNVPILSAGESVTLDVRNTLAWVAQISWTGLAISIAGFAVLITSLLKSSGAAARWLRAVAIAVIGLGVLLQFHGAVVFFGLLALATIAFLLAPSALRCFDGLRSLSIRVWKILRRAKKSPPQQNDRGDAAGAMTTAVMLLAFGAGLSYAPELAADDSNPSKSLIGDSLNQEWQVSDTDQSLRATAKLSLTGKPGDRFVLLRGPAVLTRFEGGKLRLGKQAVAGEGLVYTVMIPMPDEQNDGEQNEDKQDRQPAEEPGAKASASSLQTFAVEFDYRLDAVQATDGVPILTGPAAVHKINLEYSQSGWDVLCDAAMRVSRRDAEGSSRATLLLAPISPAAPPPRITFRAGRRDWAGEDTQFYVEGAHVFTPGPGVVNGRHRFDVRAAQGRVRKMEISIPQGLTVSTVGGPIGSWQFDADSRILRLSIETEAGEKFGVTVETQRGLAPLPSSVSLSPLRVRDASGEGGLIALAFGSDAQADQVESQNLSAVNLGDFDASLIGPQDAVLQRVYRYGEQDGALDVKVAPVSPEVRVVSQQVLSLGEERIVLKVPFVAEITRAGLFQLTFPLPAGLEIESLSGDALDHWSELEVDGSRQIVMHLVGKTIGSQTFNLTLAGPTPDALDSWRVPEFRIAEADRQTGELVVNPSTGIRLRTLTRQNVSETDPRAVGGTARGALAYRLLQNDWSLELGVERLPAWVTGEVLHDVVLREGQTRSSVSGNFQIQNASLRKLSVVLPLESDEEIRTVRVTGDKISDIVNVDKNRWEIRFKQRVIGPLPFRIEFERRGDRSASEPIYPLQFPDARQLAYFASVRAGGRLDLQSDDLPPQWQAAEWNVVPMSLRESATGGDSSPALTFRAIAPDQPFRIRVTRHSIADALKLRVAKGALTTVLSPTGDQITQLDVTMEVVQRSSLTVRLPKSASRTGGDMISILVNGESVHSIRQTDDPNAWQFYILPGIDDRTAKVQIIYALTGQGLANISLTSPELNVPLENITWQVIAPEGFVLADHEGNLEWMGPTVRRSFTRRSYLSLSKGQRESKAKQAAQMLDKANELLQSGQRTKASRAFKSVFNQYALDAASNEDARVQLENLQKQQAIVGLNTRRQRVYLYNRSGEPADAGSQQFEQAAAANMVLQQNDLDFRPQQVAELLAGNTSDDNAVLERIATRLVRHQRTTDPAPQSIVVNLPEEGNAYRFSRAVQVSENAPLALDLQFTSPFRLGPWQWVALAGMLVMVGFSLGYQRPGIDADSRA